MVLVPQGPLAQPNMGWIEERLSVFQTPAVQATEMALARSSIEMSHAMGVLDLKAEQWRQQTLQLAAFRVSMYLFCTISTSWKLHLGRKTLNIMLHA